MCTLPVVIPTAAVRLEPAPASGSVLTASCQRPPGPTPRQQLRAPGPACRGATAAGSWHRAGWTGSTEIRGLQTRQQVPLYANCTLRSHAPMRAASCVESERTWLQDNVQGTLQQSQCARARLILSVPIHLILHNVLQPCQGQRGACSAI